MTAAPPEEVFAGAVDLSLPDPLLDGGAADLDAIDLARAAQADGFAAVLVNHHRETLTQVAAFLQANDAFRPAIPVLSGIVLNTETGGLNPYAAEHCLMLGGRLVAMPTTASAHYRRTFRRALTKLPAEALRGASLSLVDVRMAVPPEVGTILDLVAKHDAVLDAGYGHLSEVLPLLAEARRRGVTRILVTDPDRYAGALPEEIAALAEGGAFLGFTLEAAADPAGRFATAWRGVRSDRIVLRASPRPGNPEGRPMALAAFARALAEAGIDGPALRAMGAENGRRLLDA